MHTIQLKYIVWQYVFMDIWYPPPNKALCFGWPPSPLFGAYVLGAYHHGVSSWIMLPESLKSGTCSNLINSFLLNPGWHDIAGMYWIHSSFGTGCPPVICTHPTSNIILYIYIYICTDIYIIYVYNYMYIYIYICFKVNLKLSSAKI